MPTPLEDRKGKAWLDVTEAKSGKVVHTVETKAYRADRVCSGMLINMSDDYFVDYRYEHPRKGEKNKLGKVVNLLLLLIPLHLLSALPQAQGVSL